MSTLHILEPRLQPDNRERRVAFSVRLDAHTKDVFAASAQAHGFDASVVARCAIELIVQRIDAGENLFDILRAFQADALPSKAQPHRRSR